MVAYNFKARFAPMVEQGTKTFTLRARARSRAGDKLQLYTGMRTKSCRKLKDAICTGVYPVTVGVNADGKGYVRLPRQADAEQPAIAAMDLEAFARADGFDGVDEFFAFHLPEDVFAIGMDIICWAPLQ